MLDDQALLGVVHSATGRRWTGPDAGTARQALAIAQRADVPEIVARVLAARGIEVEEADAYLAPTLKALMPDPSCLAGLDVAAERLARAAMAGERVAVFGDYDVDGAASAALLHDWLAAFGIVPTIHIPDRIAEGYGPNTPAMERLGRANDLVLCVDCGTATPEPIAAAMAMGAEVIVADHHLAPETLPPALAVVNPNRADCPSGLGQLCAAGVVFLLLVGANRVVRAAGGRAPDLMAALDLVAVATVADVAPLTGINRAFVRQGLKVMATRRRPGLAALADAAGLSAPPRSVDLGFVIGPRLNAGGRVGEAGLGVRLLTASDLTSAVPMAERLEEMNRERRRIEAAVLDAAIGQAEARLEAAMAAGHVAGLAWAAGEGWHPGVLGIVASRLKERFGRPAVVIGLEAAADGDVATAKGSGRSVPGVDLGSAVAALAADGVLEAGGGHAMAAGLSVRADRVESAMEALAARLAKDGLAAPEPKALAIDGIVSPAGATPELVSMLEAAGPFGQASPPPRLALAAVRPGGVRVSEKGHVSLRFQGSGGGPALSAIAFGAAENGLGRLLLDAAGAGRAVHAAGRLEIDDWGGRRRAKLRLEDAAEAG
ncbi:MAG: single-stranded-DNA-specific exonuclease RecJ [Pseudomonadota bacterium]